MTALNRLLWPTIASLLLVGCPADDPDDVPDDDDVGDDDTASDDDTTGDDDVAGCDTEPGSMATLPAGSFTMGSPEAEVGHSEDEEGHEVTLTHAYEIGTHEVNQARFEDCMGYNPNEEPDDSRPVVYVSWHEAAAFANALSVGRGLEACYSCTGSGDSVDCEPAVDPYDCGGYRMPTEAEWEYAARGGLVGASFPNGGNLVEGTEDDNSGGLFLTDDSLLDAVAWYWGNSDTMTHPAGELDANGYGLYDMAGNVYEWCHDGYQELLPDATDPIGEGVEANIRGGSWMSSPAGIRVANRFGDDPEFGDGSTGIRLVRILP
jgi:formylglycine-generating enzyme